MKKIELSSKFNGGYYRPRRLKYSFEFDSSQTLIKKKYTFISVYDRLSFNGSFLIFDLPTHIQKSLIYLKPEVQHKVQVIK
jgi:hypothetical protein